MQSRIPLSVVFSAEGKRHAIPHRTFRVPVPLTADAASTEEEKEAVAFFKYLNSNDTRLPSHPYLSAYAQPAEDYETYVGEEVWQREEEGHKQHKATTTTTTPAAAAHPASLDGPAFSPPSAVVSSSHTGASGNGDDSPNDEALSPVPAFRSVVEWVNDTFDEETWTNDGVVLCGRYVVADDGAWVVPSRSPTLFSTREVFLLMRNSCKFLQDVHTQMKPLRAAASPSCWPRHFNTASPMYLEFTLAKSLAGSGASEMRAILPYPLYLSPTTQTWGTEDSAASLSVTGIGQRMTDACFPSLMAWTEDEHDGNYRRMHRRIEQAALLERTCEIDPDFISRLVAQFHKRAKGTPRLEGSGVDHDALQHQEHLALLLTVDLLFEGVSLPIYVLSAKAQVFEVVQRTDAAWGDLLGSTASWPLWTPLLKSAEPEREGVASRGLASTQPVCASGGASTSSCDERSESEDDDAESDGEAAALNFFRMFRDVEHWNAYVVAMVRRLYEAAADSSICPDSNKPSRDVQHYCVIASESGDLVTCADTLSKRGLPLELMHPELLELNEDAAGFLKMLRDGLFKKPTE